MVRFAALGAYFLSRAVQNEKIDPTDIEIVPAETDEHQSAIDNDRIDALEAIKPKRGDGYVEC